MMRFLLFLMTLSIAACASTPDPQIQTYILEVKNEAKPDTIKSGIIAVKVKVAHYLNQPGIVLQTGPNQLTAAHYHRWAEPLTEGVRRVLAHQFHVNNALASGRVVSVELFRFHGTRNGFALASGHWSIYDGQKERPLHQQPFDLQTTLNQAGYEALVKALGMLLDQIGRDIAIYLDQNS